MLSFIIDFFIYLFGKEKRMESGSLHVVFLVDFLYLASWKGDGNGAGKPHVDFLVDFFIYLCSLKEDEYDAGKPPRHLSCGFLYLSMLLERRGE
jgi:hypothetical protein